MRNMLFWSLLRKVIQFCGVIVHMSQFLTNSVVWPNGMRLGNFFCQSQADNNTFLLIIYTPKYSHVG